MGKLFKFGCIGVVVLVVLAVIVVAAAPKSNTATTGNTNVSTGSQAVTSTVVPLAKIGDKLIAPNWEITVGQPERTKTLVWSAFGNKTDAKGEWLIIPLTLKNIGKANFSINTSDFELTTADGVKYQTSSDGISYNSFNKMTNLGEQMPPGVELKSSLVYDVGPTATGLKMNVKQAKMTVDLGQ